MTDEDASKDVARADSGATVAVARGQQQAGLEGP
jgi:hypothetical protein